MNAIATIPMAGDLASLVGQAAERVENRSLLLDKYAFHKKWPIALDDNGKEVKWDEASRWSFIRIADEAASILQKEAKEKLRKASGSNVESHNRERYNAEARIAEALSNVKWDSRELQDLRSRHTRRFIGLFRSAYGDRATIAIGQLEGRLAINLADGLIPNAGICLDRLFGMPYIPGSAIKGVCRHAALEDLKNVADDAKRALFDTFRAVFGTAKTDFDNGNLKDWKDLVANGERDRKGAICFLPAYPIKNVRIVVDLTNVHYPDYYRTDEPKKQSKEHPQPNPFPAVEVGSQFAFILVPNGRNQDASLMSAARRWLEAALTNHGLGGKTASGYGWFSLQPEVLSDLEAEERQELEKADAKIKADREAEEAARAEAARVASLDPEDRASEELLKLGDEAFNAFAKVLDNKEEIQQRAFVGLLRAHEKCRARWKVWKKKKPDLSTAIQAVVARLNLPPLP